MAQRKKASGTKDPVAEAGGASQTFTRKTPTKIPEGVSKPGLYVYKDLVEVPIAFRVLQGAMLNVHQVNEIMARAHDEGFWNTDDKGVAIHFIPHYGQARQEFVEQNEVKNGVWVPKAKA